MSNNTDIYSFHSGKKALAILIDPDAYNEVALKEVIEKSNSAGVNFLLVGGSLTFSSVEDSIKIIRRYSELPVFLFPGNILQISSLADGILFLSLISGRNPEFLIGHHVLAAPEIKKCGIDVFPTAYILIGNGKQSSVEYMSNTSPIPSDKSEIAVATAIAGELLGMKLCYLEAGSGAENSVGLNMISEVRKNISSPLIVGGGIRSGEQAEKIYLAGADIIVAGNGVEQNPELILTLAKIRDKVSS
ncbi:MAG: geranylgeranylglyceryl/heptaprenylglyceryl phosphate synthase [Bacteroidales bacterium]|nr:geranylgeranylglyceryl/heptaprenylglyceryl phosphate synthase [Bacteroidales bacterium]MCF8390303.1 geranylgeranylglyceryl/heptaprenylglyceryl phosphate synthase [Bacteroidales bacterium]